MASNKSRFKPLPELEKEICLRLGDQRRGARISQAEFAAAVGLTRAQLANIESMRVPLRFWTGWRACAKLAINQRWLATGDLPSRPFVDLDLNKCGKTIIETKLFSEVCKRQLHTDLDFRSDMAWTIGQYQSSGDAIDINDFEQTLEAIIKTYLLKIPIESRAKVISFLLRSLPSVLKSLSVESAKKK